MKKILNFSLIMLIFISFSLLFFNFEAKAVETTPNVPLFYGTTEIEIDKNVIDNASFDVLDSRFRVFARDYEDGDLTPSIICTYNDVVANVAGLYTIKYCVADSDNNKVDLEVAVKVNDNAEGNIKVTRRTYAIPAMKTMKDIGMDRCNAGDRQNLGIYLKADSSFTLKAKEAISKKTEVTFFTDTRNENSFAYINAGSTDEVVMKNVRNSVSYNAVPFLTSIRLDTEDVNTTYDYELSYNKDEALALDYYHYKDDESKFYDNWNTSLNDFAVVDSEVIQMVVPVGDINNLGKTFAALDQVCEYYIEVINRMDKMVGLSFNPTNDYDFNYRTKYIAVCDKNYGAAGAYYMGSYIAVCSSSIYGFFTYGWGSLHELAHGYQGYFGKGYGGGDSLYFNETGNNVLAYYIQTDKTLYKDSGLWLGKMEDIEVSLNEKRLNGTNVFNNDSGTYTNVREKLYFILNLMNCFEGSDTYAKLFSYYREIFSKYGNDKYTTADIYAKFFKEYYNTDILAYLDAWHIKNSNEVLEEILDSNATSYFIKNDYDEGLVSDGSLKYSLISEDEIENKKIGSLTINIDSSLCLNKVIGVFQKGKLLSQVKITSDTLTINNLTYGNYRIIVPSLLGYSGKEVVYVNIKSETNEINYEYEKLDYSYDPSMKLWIRGVYETVGLTFVLSDNNTKGVITLGGANLGNQTNYWANNPDLIFISVSILDNDGNTIKEYIVKGNNYFTAAGEGCTLDLEYGYKVVIYTEKPGYVNMWYGNNLLTDFNVTDNNITYEITENGFKLLNKESLDTKEVIYNIDRVNFIEEIRNYKEKISDKELYNKNINTTYKTKIITYYNYLNESDKLEFSDFINKLILGGTPNITIIKEDNTFDINTSIDLKSFISVYDAEDYYIDDYSVISSLDTNKVGSYDILYTIYDTDNNKVELTINIIIRDFYKENLDKEKAIKIDSINNVILNYNESNYSSANWNSILNYINSEKDIVNNMTKVEDVSNYNIDSLLNYINSIKTLSIELSEAKSVKIKEIESLLTKYPDNNYSSENNDKKNEIITKALEDINSASDINDVSSYDIDSLDTLLQSIETIDNSIKVKHKINFKLLGIIMGIVFGGFALVFMAIFIIYKMKNRRFN